MFLIIFAASLSLKWWKDKLYKCIDLWSPEELDAEEVFDTTKGGAWEVSVASTAWGMKLRFAEWDAKDIQASRLGWKSERRKGMGLYPAWDRVLLMDFSIKGVGPMWVVVLDEILEEYKISSADSDMDIVAEMHECL